jgi:hypothetical protein
LAVLVVLAFDLIRIRSRFLTFSTATSGKAGSWIWDKHLGISMVVWTAETKRARETSGKSGRKLSFDEDEPLKR